MAPPKKHSAAVATYGDHEVISPENKLRKAASKAPYAPGDDPIARAEKALAELSGEFSSWMDTECERLDQARRNVAAGGFTAANMDALFRAAHDIKGEAATFGFPGHKWRKLEGLNGLHQLHGFNSLHECTGNGW